MRFNSTPAVALILVLSVPALFAQDTSHVRPESSHHHMDHHMSDGMGPDFRIAPPGMWWKNPGLIDKLGLTVGQQKRMDGIFQRSKLQLIDLKAALDKEEVTLRPMLSENPPDTNKVLAQIDRVAHARANLERGNARMLLGIRRVLTPDQWTKLQAADREYRHKMMMRRFHPDGQEPPAPGALSTPKAPPTP